MGGGEQKKWKMTTKMTAGNLFGGNSKGEEATHLCTH